MRTAPRVVVIGLDCAAPQLVFDRFSADLPHLTALRQRGQWGTLQSVVPAITVPAWACAMSGRDPGQLGLYGFQNRVPGSYDFRLVDASALDVDCVWDLLSAAGESVVLVGVPPSYPPRPVRGVRVGCLLTPHKRGTYTHPPELAAEIEQVTRGAYAVDVEGTRGPDRGELRDAIYRMTRQRFTLFGHLLRTRPWSFAMVVEIGLDRMQHAFWSSLDDSHAACDPADPHRCALRDYYRLLDAEVGQLVAGLDRDTAVLVMSDHGAQTMRGGIRVNEWLLSEGFLRLKAPVAEATPLHPDLVDWSTTRAWGGGGYCGRIFINERGREPNGIVEASERESLLCELERGLRDLTAPDGRGLATRTFRPERIYVEQRGLPPDLLVYFDDLAWRALSGVGTGRLHARSNDRGPDGANHAEQGLFILAAPGLGDRGERLGARLVDCGPTVLSLLGQRIPPEMIGRSLTRV